MSTAKKLKIQLFGSWWVLFFALLCYIAYEQSVRMRQQQFDTLSDQLATLQKDKKKALVIQKDLLLQVNSQSDPAWIELTLMKVLGLVPEGQIKVLFIQ